MVVVVVYRLSLFYVSLSFLVIYLFSMKHIHPNRESYLKCTSLLSLSLSFSLCLFLWMSLFSSLCSKDNDDDDDDDSTAISLSLCRFVVSFYWETDEKSENFVFSSWERKNEYFTGKRWKKKCFVWFFSICFNTVTKKKQDPKETGEKDRNKSRISFQLTEGEKNRQSLHSSLFIERNSWAKTLDHKKSSCFMDWSKCRTKFLC